MLKKYFIAMIVTLLFTPIVRAEKKTFGAWLRERVDDVDRKIQDTLEKNPEVQTNINRGIDKFADNLIDFATPKADKECRRMQKDAVQAILNPNHRESSKHFQRLLGTAAGTHRNSNSRSYTSSHSRPRTKSLSLSSTPVSSSTQNVTKSQKNNGELWVKVDHYIIATTTLFQDAHESLASFLHDEFDLNREESVLAASAIMVIVSLLAIVILWRILRRSRLKSRLCQVERELAALQEERSNKNGKSN